MQTRTGLIIGIGILLAGIILWWGGSGPAVDRRPAAPAIRLPQASELGVVLPETPPHPVPPTVVRPTPPAPSPTSADALTPPPTAVRELNEEGAIAY